MKATAFVALSLLALLAVPANAWWPFSDDDDIEEARSQATNKNGGSPSPGLVPFEIKTADQKFLEEAQQLLKLSPLDHCQHEVIGILKKSCGDMTEEELAKMSVRLLNCQAQAEGRQTFACSADMTVAECTRPMDAHMWNAYHIISNRARSVCYATRQHQFRAQTEKAVNHLAHSALEQIQAMDSLAKSQKEVQQLAEDSMSTIKKEQDQLLQRQSNLAAKQHLLRNRITDNLQQLAEEKLVIHRGQRELANTTENIRKQLARASSMLAEQEEQRKKNQAQVAKDLSKLKDDIKEVWTRIDNSTMQLFDLLEKMSVQYESTLQNLKTINSTVSQVLQLLDAMNDAIGIQLQWVSQHLGGAKDGLKTLTALALHGFFLLISSLILLLVRAPWLTRLVLLPGVVCNLIAELKFDTSLSLTQLSVSVMAVLISNWCMIWWQQTHSKVPLQKLKAPSRQQLLKDTTPDNSNTNTMYTTDISDSEVNDLYADNTLDSSAIKREMTNGSDIMFSFNRTSTPRKCAAIARTGLPCRLTAIHGQHYCHRHM